MSREGTDDFFKMVRRVMGEDRLKRARLRALDLMAEMPLSQLRKLLAKTQRELARHLGIRQPSLSKMEAQSDMQIGTLAKLIRAMGGELELVARLPTGDVRVGQFKVKPKATTASRRLTRRRTAVIS